MTLAPNVGRLDAGLGLFTPASGAEGCATAYAREDGSFLLDYEIISVGNSKKCIFN